MDIYSIKFKVKENPKPIIKNIRAAHMHEAMQKIKEMYQSAVVISYMQM